MTALMDAVKSVSLVITDEVKAKKHVAHFPRRSPSPGLCFICLVTFHSICVSIPYHRRGCEGDDVKVVVVWSTGLFGSPPGLLVRPRWHLVVASGPLVAHSGSYGT